MKRKGKDPFKNRAITLFVYNLGELKNSPDYRTIKEKLRQKTYGDGEIIETFPTTNFGQIFKAHFGEVKEEGVHKIVIKDSYKVYYYDLGVETNSMEVMVAGKQAIVEILELGRIHNWAVMAIDRSELIHLDSLPSYGYLNLDEYFGDGW